MRKVIGSLLALGSAATVWAQGDASACDEPRAPAVQPMPAEAVTSARPAQAIWLDAERLLWPGQTVAGRYRLVHAAQGTLRAEVGSAVQGVERWVPLQPAAPLSATAAERWRHVAPGALLAPAQALSRTDLRTLLQGELLLVRLDDQDRLVAATRLQHPAALDALYATAALSLPFGTQWTATGVEGRLWAPTARRVDVCLYPTARGAASRRMSAQWEAASGSWQWQAQGVRPGEFYNYLVEVWVPGRGWLRQRVTDPYAVSLNANSLRSAFIDFNSPAVTPPGWRSHATPRPQLKLHEMVVYELHVRDFSLNDPRVRAAWRGKYRAFTEMHSHGMQHLRELARAGVTDLHLLPVFDLATVPERGCVQVQVPKAGPDSDVQQAAVMAHAAGDCFNWGYDPYHFNAPEGSYATEADDPQVRVREFRQMVQALHGAGLRVGMDVVYNHTSAAGPQAPSVLDRIVPGYYHRLNANGDVENSTCCANTATEHALMGKLMSDSLRLWAVHYRLDSFRFDLMGHQPRAAMLAARQRLREETGRDILFLGEGWNFGEVADGARFHQASQNGLVGDGIGTFSDRARDALRGGSFGSVAELQASRGWSNGLLESGDGEAQRRAADGVRLGLAGTLRDYRFENADGQIRRGADMLYAGRAGAGYAAAPGEAVAYVENHDNHTLFDANVLKMPTSASARDRAQAQAVASAAVLFSQGVAYVHAGQELLRSKSLDRNSFDSGDWFNRYDPSLRDNGFAAGLPPAAENGRDFEALKPLLRLAHAKPDASLLRQARESFLDLLRIREGSSLFRLPTAEEVQKRLRFHNTGPQQDPAVIVAELDGEAWPGANARGLLIVLNGAAGARRLQVPALASAAWRLHPQLARSGAGDARLRAQAHLVGGNLRVPARSAVVFVR